MPRGTAKALKIFLCLGWLNLLPGAFCEAGPLTEEERRYYDSLATRLITLNHLIMSSLQETTSAGYTSADFKQTLLQLTDYVDQCVDLSKHCPTGVEALRRAPMIGSLSSIGIGIIAYAITRDSITGLETAVGGYTLWSLVVHIVRTYVPSISHAEAAEAYFKASFAAQSRELSEDYLYVADPEGAVDTMLRLLADSQKFSMPFRKQVRDIADTTPHAQAYQRLKLLWTLILETPSALHHPFDVGAIAVAAGCSDAFASRLVWGRRAP